MTKLKLGLIADDKPVKISLELPAAVHRDLIAYADLLGRNTGQPIPEPTRLIVPMIEQFMISDRVFTKARRQGNRQSGISGIKRSE